MDAVKLLKQDHKEVADLVARFEKAAESEKVAIARRICLLLTVHARIEEELFYPAAREALGKKGTDLIDEAEVEHASVKDLVAQIEGSSPKQDELFEAKVKVMGEYVKHHVKEEETELFPKVRKSDLDLDELGEQLAERKRELLAEMGEEEAMEAEEEEEEAPIRARASRSSGQRERRPAVRARRGNSSRSR